MGILSEEEGMKDRQVKITVYASYLYLLYLTISLNEIHIIVFFRQTANAEHYIYFRCHV